MLKQNNGNGNQANAQRTVAGKPAEFWKKLLEKEPVRKPEPKPPVERIPEMQLKQMRDAIRDMKDTIALESWGAVSKKLGELHWEDAFGIWEAAVTSPWENIALEAVDLIPSISRLQRFRLAEIALESRYSAVQERALEFVARDEWKEFLENIIDLDVEDAVVILRAGLETLETFCKGDGKKAEEIAPHAGVIMLALIGEIALDERVGLLKIALKSAHEGVAWGAIRYIADEMPQEKWPELLEIALKSKRRGSRLIIAGEMGEHLKGIPLGEQEGLLKAAFKSPDFLAISLLFELLKNFAPEKQAELVGIALSEGVERAQEKAFSHISGLPENERLRLVKIALKSPLIGVRKMAISSLHGSTTFLTPKRRAEALELAEKGIREALVLDPPMGSGWGAPDLPKLAEAHELIKASPYESQARLLEAMLRNGRYEVREEAVKLIEESILFPDAKGRLIRTGLEADGVDSKLKAKLVELIPLLDKPRQLELAALALKSSGNVWVEGTFELLKNFTPAERAGLMKEAIEAEDEGRGGVMRGPSVGLRLLKLIPESKARGEEAALIMAALGSKRTEVRLKAIELVFGLPQKYHEKFLNYGDCSKLIQWALPQRLIEMGKACELARNFPPEEHADILKALFRMMMRPVFRDENRFAGLYLIRSGIENALLAGAVERIPEFSPEQQAELVKAALGCDSHTAVYTVLEILPRLQASVKESLWGDAERILKECIKSMASTEKELTFIRHLPEAHRAEPLKAIFVNGLDDSVGLKALAEGSSLPSKKQQAEVIGAAFALSESAVVRACAAEVAEGILGKALQAEVFVPALRSRYFAVKLKAAGWCMTHPLSVYRHCTSKKA